MKITNIRIGFISVPLTTPFKTAMRTVNSVNDVIVEVHTDTGNIGYGEAAPTGVITGDTTGAIIGAIEDHIKKALINLEIEDIETIMLKLNSCIVNNNSAKAAVDIAIYDLFGQLHKTPVYKLLGGHRKELTTDITISVNEPEEMARDSIRAVNLGYRTLKIKVGKNAQKDILRMQAIRDAIGYDIDLRVDANQGWTPKEAVKAIRKMEDIGLNLEFIEQPVLAHDLVGFKHVTDNVDTPTLADESVFSPQDALKILQQRAADIINIKLMKTAGIYNALKITSIAEVYGVDCMIGCMLEAKVSVTAAVHLAAAKSIITKIDLDGPVLCSEDPVHGGAIFDEYKITLNNDPGFGVKSIDNIVYKD
jgi:o-succinylbenzoate synthase